MYINVAEVFKVKKQLTDTYSSLKRSFQGITNEITEINNNLQSTNLSSRNNKLLEKVSSLSTTMETNLSGLVLFMEAQLNNYEISSSEAKAQLLELIKLIESTFGSKGELLNSYNTAASLVNAQVMASPIIKAGTVGAATLGAAAPLASIYTPAENYSYVQPTVSSSVTTENLNATPKATPTAKSNTSSQTKTPAAKTAQKATTVTKNSGNVPPDLYSKGRISQSYARDGNGVDLGWRAAGDNNVYAYADGVVIEVVNNQGPNKGSKGMTSYGNYVKIKHADGTMTLYAHMAEGSVNVSQNQILKAGDPIGIIGETGNAYGPHLHFEYRNSNDQRLDPTPLLTGGSNVTKI